MKKRHLLPLLSFALFTACEKKDQTIVITADDFHMEADKITEIMIHDIFSPPVASRIFAYPNVAAYEIIAQANPEYSSLVGTVTDLEPIPPLEPSKNINPQLAALIAHIDLSKSLIFSEHLMESYRDSLYTAWENINPLEFNASKAYALEVAAHITKWMSKDNYKQTRTMPKFTVMTDDASRWQPTPPAYMDGIEPHWSKIRPFVIDSASQFKPVPPPPFSMEEGSEFHTQLKEIYDIGLRIKEEGDESEELKMAQFWDCNPYVSVTYGHLMFATKKISPGAHWMGIAKIACKKTNADVDRSIYAYTKTSLAIVDGFISCWDEKYRSNLIRPETLINQYMDENWRPVLQTPPFPEYTSGHSVVSGAASVVLTNIFGDNFAFDDDTEVPYGLPVRSFTSFENAAMEAAMSRMYGGIHYRAAVEVGIKQGRDLGNFVVDKLPKIQKDALATNSSNKQ
tara:strand:+ start:98068 stop:99432 length:1365 start_codon:yes stop_codon:yes gene_type:complete